MYAARLQFHVQAQCITDRRQYLVASTGYLPLLSDAPAFCVCPAHGMSSTFREDSDLYLGLSSPSITTFNHHFNLGSFANLLKAGLAKKKLLHKIVAEHDEILWQEWKESTQRMEQSLPLCRRNLKE